MATRVEGDVQARRLEFATDTGRRLVFPHAQLQRVDGASGRAQYGAADCAFEALEGRLDRVQWEAGSASLGSAWLRDDAGRYDIAVDRIELPHGIRLVRAQRGIEILSQHASLSELRLTVKGPFARGRAAAERSIASAGEAGARAKPAGPPPTTRSLRQERLRFLDSVSGRIYLTIKVQLDLPVLGMRTLDQQLRVPIQEGSLDYRALEDSLDWLEGRVLEVDHDMGRLRVSWKVPIVGAPHDLISWALDTDADTLASFGRVPLRALADFRLANGGAKAEDKKPRKIVQAFTLDAIDVALSLLAPRNLEAGGGMILFGGEDQPGIVDLKVTGAIRAKGVGALRGAIGSIDTTVKDLRVGPATVSADRLHFDGLDQLEVSFDGFRPTAVTVVVHRVTATNLALQLGRD
ncbi:MAG TPA: hypothetical protein VGF94_11270 [Kofleriaceae bacterium]|jgi:hypothetical protein